MTPTSVKSDAIQYLFAVSPLVFGHIVIPPISFFYGEDVPPVFEFVYRYITPGEFLSLNSVLSLTLDPSQDKSLEQWLPWFSHMFVHGTYKHLLQNIQGLLLSGYPIYSALGFDTMCLLFILGGACSELPSIIHETQVGKLPGTALLPRFVRQGLRNLLKFLRREVHCGSSGGIFALIGSSTVLNVRCAYRLAMECHRAGQSMRSRSRKGKIGTGFYNYIRGLIGRLLKFDTVSLACRVCGEYLTIAKEVDYLTSESNSKINYAAHVQGYLFGCASTAVLLLVTKK